LVLLSTQPDSLAESFSANAGGASSGDLLCYREIGADGDKAVLIRLDESGPTRLCVIAIPAGSHDPLCLSNGLILTTTDGRILRYDQSGKLLFSTELEGFSGASKFSSRLSESIVVVEQTWSNPMSKVLLHELIFVDVSTSFAKVKGRVSTGQVFRVIRCGPNVFACGVDQAKRLNLPYEVQKDMDICPMP
jgi:hypothetical protein